MSSRASVASGNSESALADGAYRFALQVDGYRGEANVVVTRGKVTGDSGRHAFDGVFRGRGPSLAVLLHIEVRSCAARVHEGSTRLTVELRGPWLGPWFRLLGVAPGGRYVELEGRRLDDAVAGPAATGRCDLPDAISLPVSGSTVR